MRHIILLALSLFLLSSSASARDEGGIGPMVVPVPLAAVAR